MQTPFPSQAPEGGDNKDTKDTITPVVLRHKTETGEFTNPILVPMGVRSVTRCFDYSHAEIAGLTEPQVRPIFREQLVHEQQQAKEPEDDKADKVLPKGSLDWRKLLKRAASQSGGRSVAPTMLRMR